MRHAVNQLRTATAGGWFVSNSGNDSNNGRSSQTPFLTIAHALSVYTSGIVYLARGSTFREELTGFPAGVAVRAYGSGASPLIDAREIAVNASFIKTGGRTNVYEIAWSHSFDDDGGKCKHRAWENGVMLTRVASVAACDATAGTFYAGAPTNGGPDTIYIHPNGNTDARSDGKSYSFSKRRWSIQLYMYINHASVYGVDTIGNAHADGSLVVDGTASSCVAYDGRIHNVFVRGLAQDITAFGVDQGEDYAQFVSYQNAGGPSVDGRNTIYRRCTANANATTTIGTGFYAHTDGLTSFGVIQYEDCNSIGNSGAYGGVQAATFLYYRCRYTDTLAAYAAVGVTRTVMLGGWGTTRENAGGPGVNNDNKALSFSTTATFALIAQGLKCYRLGSGQGPFYVNCANVTAQIRRCSVYAEHVSNLPMAGSFAFDHNAVSSFLGTTGMGIGTAGANLASFVADSNVYHQISGFSAWTKYFGGTVDYFTIADWRTYLAGVGFGPETASLQNVDPQFTDPANGDFTIGNATVRALGAGAEQNEANDAALQALWNLYRVAA